MTKQMGAQVLDDPLGHIDLELGVRDSNQFVQDLYQKTSDYDGDQECGDTVAEGFVQDSFDWRRQLAPTENVVEDHLQWPWC